MVQVLIQVFELSDWNFKIYNEIFLITFPRITSIDCKTFKNFWVLKLTCIYENVEDLYNQTLYTVM